MLSAHICIRIRVCLTRWVWLPKFIGYSKYFCCVFSPGYKMISFSVFVFLVLFLFIVY